MQTATKTPIYTTALERFQINHKKEKKLDSKAILSLLDLVDSLTQRASDKSV